MELVAFPTRVILMAEYGHLLPLWDRYPSPDMWFGPFERAVLGLSVELETRLVRWNDRFESLMGPRQEWSSPQERLTFIVDGHLLAADVQRELGSDVVVLYLDADDERSRGPQPEHSGEGSWLAVAPNRGAFSPAQTEHRSMADQLRTMSGVDFESVTRDFDSSRHVWGPGRAPSRILLQPQKIGLPLLDRSPVIDMATDRLKAETLGLSDRLVTRLAHWNDGWTSGSLGSMTGWRGELLLRYLVDGHEVAADVQREVGPEVAILFPEADAGRSKAPAEMKQVVTRMRAAQGGSRRKGAGEDR